MEEARLLYRRTHQKEYGDEAKTHKDLGYVELEIHIS
jgi:hypothetical protein